MIKLLLIFLGLAIQLVVLVLLFSAIFALPTAWLVAMCEFPGRQYFQWLLMLPLAMPGMLTGTIIGMAQALGETAPLLMIGMVAFIVDIPQGFTDAATVLPVQVYIWSDSPERAFIAKTSAAIMVLLGFLALMNLLAVLLRRKFERRW
jgi:ABC-type phosphate transport system permease subunit